MSFLIRNKTSGPAVDVEIKDLGITVKVGVDFDLTNENSAKIANSTDLQSAITANDIVVIDPLDGTTELSLADSVATKNAANDPHWRLGAGSRINDLSDVDVTGASIGDVLRLGGTGSWDDTDPSTLAANQDIWETISADTGSTTANTTTDTLTIAGAGVISTSITGDTLTISDSGQDLFETITPDSGGSVVADSPTDTLTLTGGTGITTVGTPASDTITITNTAPNVDQNIWETIVADTGSTVASTTFDTLTVAGGTGITTTIVGDTLTIDATAGAGLQNIVEDTTPQLGGNLDVNGFSIISVSAGNIAITPDTTGSIVLDGLNWPQADGTLNQVLTTNGAGQLAFQDTGDIAIFELEWRFSTSTVEADPGSGIFRYNNATLASVTAIFFDDETQNGIDVGALISALNPGDKLFIEQTNQSSRAVLFSVTGTPTDNTGFFTVPVSVDASGTLHQNNQRCAVLFLFTGDGDSTFTDDLFRIQDDGDNTRQIAFQASAITTATTRTITMADQDISLVPNTGSFLGDVIGDTTPQLGGNLDVNGNSIVSAAAGNIAITPDTTGSIVLDGINWPQADGTINQILETDGAGQLSFVTLSAGGPEFADNVFRIVDNVDATKKLAWEVTAITTATTRTWTVPDQNLDFTPDTGDFLANVIGDTTPQLGGNLDVNGNSIVSAAAGNIAITPDTTGNLVLDGLNWPQADGTVSQILRTNGAGQLSFQDQNLIVSFVIEDPTTADAGLLQHKFGQAVTITRISASTDVGTVTIQFDERVEATPNTSGTDVMTAVLIADTNTEATTAFANANIAADAVLNLDIDAVATSPGVVRIHVEYRPQ